MSLTIEMRFSTTSRDPSFLFGRRSITANEAKPPCRNRMTAGIGKSRLISRVMPASAPRVHSSPQLDGEEDKGFDDRSAIILLACKRSPLP